MAGDDAAFWDELFAGLAVTEAAAAEHWIERVLPDAAARAVLGGRVLELGCGLGYDTRWLVQAGGQVTALDGSAVALDRLAAALPGPEYVQHCLPAPLPFPAASFDAVAAGLSLHYFPWDDTLAIINEVHRVLRPGGLFVFAVNASNDVEFGYGRGVEIEPGLFAFDGRRKRFFSEADCRRLLAAGWDVLTLLPLEEQRYGRLKRMWAAAALAKTSGAATSEVWRGGAGRYRAPLTLPAVEMGAKGRKTRDPGSGVAPAVICLAPKFTS